MEHRTNNIRVLAALVAAAGLILIIFSLMAFQSGVGTSGEHGGMMSTSTGIRYYTLTNMFLAMVGAMLLASGVIFAVLWQPSGTASNLQSPLWAAGSNARPEQAPMAYSAPRGPALATIGNEMASPIHVLPNQSEAAGAAPPCPMPEMESSLVLRLLNGDERTIFRTIKESGGEVLQRDIVVTTKMSEAKVSRVLDRLVEKGLVVKERNGMGNKVRIHIEA